MNIFAPGAPSNILQFWFNTDIKLAISYFAIIGCPCHNNNLYWFRNSCY